MGYRQSSTSTRSPLFERCLFGVLLLLLIWLPLPWGSNRPLAMACIGIAANMLLLLWIALCLMGWVRWPEWQAPLPWVLPLWLAWLLWQVLSLVPLPLASIAALNPLIADHKKLLGIDPAPLSLVPGNTVNRLLLSEAYFALFLSTWLLAGSRNRQRWVLQVLVVSGAAQALYGSLMLIGGWSLGAFGQTKIAYLDSATGTFINRNHLAGYLELCGAAAFGLLWMDLGGPSRMHWRARLRAWLNLFFSNKLFNRVLMAVMVIGLVLTRSRMGNIAFFVGLAAAGLLVLLLHERRHFLRGLLLLASLAAVDLGIISRWYGLDALRDRIEGTHIETDARGAAFPEFLPVLRDFWTTGAGAGSFARVFPQYQSSAVAGYWDHAHNDYAEILIETGLPGGMLLGLIALSVFAHALGVLRRRRERQRIGVALAGVMALTCLALHGVFDFNLQIPANAATLVVIMALVVRIPLHGRGRLALRRGMEYKNLVGGRDEAKEAV